MAPRARGVFLGECGWNDSKEELRRRPAVGWILSWGGAFGNWVLQYSAQSRSEAELGPHQSEQSLLRKGPF